MAHTYNSDIMKEANWTISKIYAHGYSFRINIKYDSGQILSSGYGVTSLNYRIGHRKLVEYLEELVQKQTYKN